HRKASFEKGATVKGSSRFFEPLPGFFNFSSVEISDLGLRERLAHLSHPRLPFPVADQGDALDAVAVGGGELDVVPQGVQVPAVELMELSQEPAPAFPRRHFIDQRNELSVVLIMQPARQLEAENFCGALGKQLDHGKDLLFGTGFICVGDDWETPIRRQCVQPKQPGTRDQKPGMVASVARKAAPTAKAPIMMRTTPRPTNHAQHLCRRRYSSNLGLIESA